MFPGLEFHTNQLNDRANMRLDRYPMKPYAVRLVWSDLGVVDLHVPTGTGHVSLSLDQLVVHAEIVKDPVSEEPYAWLY
jgi:hypothetical protein